MESKKQGWSKLRRMTHGMKCAVGDARVTLIQMLMVKDDLKQINKALIRRQKMRRALALRQGALT